MEQEKYNEKTYIRACEVVEETKAWVKKRIAQCVVYDDFLNIRKSGKLFKISEDKSEVRGGVEIYLELDRWNGYCVAEHYGDGYLSTNPIKTANFSKYDYLRSRTDVVEFAAWVIKNWALIKESIDFKCRNYMDKKELIESRLFAFKVED